MPKLKSLSAQEVIRILNSFEFYEVSKKGSHVKLRRMLSSGTRETLIVPDHKTLDRGTLRAIFLQTSRYVPGDELREHFFTEN